MEAMKDIWLLDCGDGLGWSVIEDYEVAKEHPDAIHYVTFESAIEAIKNMKARMAIRNTAFGTPTAEVMRRNMW